MKRTRQVFHYEADAIPSDISGCRMFHGEDLSKFMATDIYSQLIYLHIAQDAINLYKTVLKWCFCNIAFQDRSKHQADTQKQWVNEQKAEKNQINKNTDEEEK